ncbi:MAG: hypothetical protein ACKVZ0_19595 [Gemmatimonadales bacterium]
MSRSFIRIGIGAVASILVGCASEQRAPEPQSVPAAPVAPPVVEIIATDFAFQVPDTIPGGWVTLRIRNTGQELHHGALYRLDQGKTVADVLKLSGPQMPEWMVAVGGPSGANPGATLETTVQLAPGSYLLLCEIPSPDGKLHLMKGMMRPMTVVAPTTEAAAPSSDIEVRLSDFSFEFSKELVAGKHTFRVETAPGQAHEVVIARLLPGKKAEDLLAWVENMAGPPPIEGVVGGTTALAAGTTNVFQAELVPGDYAVICFIPDVKDGKAHAHHGMMKTVKIS